MTSAPNRSGSGAQQDFNPARSRLLYCPLVGPDSSGAHGVSQLRYSGEFLEAGDVESRWLRSSSLAQKGLLGSCLPHYTGPAFVADSCFGRSRQTGPGVRSCWGAKSVVSPPDHLRTGRPSLHRGRASLDVGAGCRIGRWIGSRGAVGCRGGRWRVVGGRLSIKDATFAEQVHGSSGILSG